MEVSGAQVWRRRILFPNSYSGVLLTFRGVARIVQSTRSLFVPGILVLMTLGCGMVVAEGAATLAVALLGLVALVLIAVWGKLTAAAVLVAAALYQAPLVGIGPVPGMTLSEFAAPVIFIVLCFQAVGRERRWREWGLVEKAILIFAIVLAANLLRSKYLLTTIPGGVNRAYYDYFVGLAMFAAAYQLLAQRRIDTLRMLRLLYIFSAIGALLGLIIVAANLPVNAGNLRYSVYDYSSGAVRVGFLENFAVVGFAITVTHPVRYRVLGIGVFGAALILSGGRATAIGILVAGVLYLVFVSPKTFRMIVIAALGGCILALAALWVWPTVRQQPQVQRLTAIDSQTFGVEGRQLIYEQSLADFERHPVLGTGLGVPSYAVGPDMQASSDPRVTDFYRAQLEVGGHATYAALLKNFGFAGAIPFLVALVAAIIGAASTADRIGGFFVVVLVTQMVAMIVGGNGSDPFFFLLLGACAAWLATRREVGRPATEL